MSGTMQPGAADGAAPGALALPRGMLPGWTLLGLAALVLACEGAAGAAVLAVLGEGGPAILASLANLLVGLRFAVTLLPGREPLISRYSRFDPAGVPDADGAYTRRLTQLWAALLGGFALAFAAAAVASWPIAALSAAQPLACAGLFLGEHVLRNRRFPQLGRATPLRTLRAICLSHSGSAAGAAAVVRHAA